MDTSLAAASTDLGAVRHERFFERHAWKIFFALSVIVVLFGLGDLVSGGSTYQSGEVVLFTSITGTTWDELRVSSPRIANMIDQQVRSGGAGLLVVGLLSGAICLNPLRRGERWAWLTMWVWPAWAGLAVLVILTADRSAGSGIPVPVISGSVFFVLSVVTLALSYRKYFGQT